MYKDIRYVQGYKICTKIYVQGYKICTGANITHFYLSYIFIIYICLKQNYIKQYKRLQFNHSFLWILYFIIDRVCQKTGAIQDF